MYVIEKNGNLLFEDDKFWVFQPVKEPKIYKNLKSAKKKACLRSCNVLEIPENFIIDKSGDIYNQDMVKQDISSLVVFDGKKYSKSLDSH